MGRVLVKARTRLSVTGATVVHRRASVAFSVRKQLPSITRRAFDQTEQRRCWIRTWHVGQSHRSNAYRMLLMRNFNCDMSCVTIKVKLLPPTMRLSTHGSKRRSGLIVILYCSCPVTDTRSLAGGFLVTTALKRAVVEAFDISTVR
jgi:hypothetical protein